MLAQGHRKRASDMPTAHTDFRRITEESGDRMVKGKKYLMVLI